MIIEPLLNDETILEEIGQRLARRRVDFNLTQAQLAKEAGISKRTLERVEAGASAQMLTMIRILRILKLMAELDQLVPESGPRPFDLLKRKGKERKRSSSRPPEQSNETEWSWGDDS